jgi:hypothetical protein
MALFLSFHPSAALDWIPGFLPGIEPTQDDLDLGEPLLIQLQRRTGAGLLGGSGAVEYNLGGPR